MVVSSSFFSSSICQNSLRQLESSSLSELLELIQFETFEFLHPFHPSLPEQRGLPRVVVHVMRVKKAVTDNLSRFNATPLIKALYRKFCY